MRSAASELSSSDGVFNHPRRSLSSRNNSREYQQIICTPSPPYSVSSNESMNMIPWEKRRGNNPSTPLESAYTSFESSIFGSHRNSVENSVAGDSEFGHTTPPKRLTEDKISALQQSVNHLNLQGRALESLPHYSFGSSDHSELQSYPSDISYELLDEPRISDSSRSSTSSSLAAVS